MLIAEIHGKRNLPIQTDEDYFTSAVFGHLRQVREGPFWNDFFGRATSVAEVGTTLAAELEAAGYSTPAFYELATTFWPSYEDYGEPDVILRFRNDSGRLLVLLIEVKLYSGKSGNGENDQLRRYYDLLQDRARFPDAAGSNALGALIYLTEQYRPDDLQDSVHLCNQALASRRMFTLQWQDVLEAASEHAAHNELLNEVAAFLKRRGLEAFKGFSLQPFAITPEQGSFYRSSYFQKMPTLASSFSGAFYG